MCGEAGRGGAKGDRGDWLRLEKKLLFGTQRVMQRSCQNGKVAVFWGSSNIPAVPEQAGCKAIRHILQAWQGRGGRT